MKTKIGLALCALAVSAAGWVVVHAAEPDVSRTTGRVLVLDNARTIEGDIERQGDQYRVRRTVGEVWVQQESVLRLCENNYEAFKFLRARANLRDPDEHVRLANWCQSHGLKQEAIEEAQKAVDIRPGHALSKRLLENLQRVQAISHGAEAPRKPAKEDHTNIAPAVNNDSLSLFVTRVQPILMNACASCHATGRGGSFKLSRTFDAGLANRKATSQNLAAVLANVSTEQPLLSRFLSMAVSVHGTMPQSPLRSRDSPAYHTLEDWVRTTVETNPQLAGKSAGAVTSISPPQAAPALLEASRQTPTEFAQLRSEQTRTNTKPTAAGSQTAVAAPAKESSLPVASSEPAGTTREPVDAFDPLIFNRQMHPPQRPDGSRQ